MDFILYLIKMMYIKVFYLYLLMSNILLTVIFVIEKEFFEAFINECLKNE